MSPFAHESVWRRLARWLRGGQRKLSVYCDGSSHAVRGLPGGWAFAVVGEGRCLHSESGGSPATTSTGMELAAAHAGLAWVLAKGWHLGAAVELVSDSRVALEAASGQGFPKAERALAEALRGLCVEAAAQVRWVRGHSGDGWNELVDGLAHEAKQARVPLRVRKKAERRKASARQPPAVGRKGPFPQDPTGE